MTCHTVQYVAHIFISMDGGGSGNPLLLYTVVCVCVRHHLVSFGPSKSDRAQCKQL